MFDVVLILGKELRRDPLRAQQELRARSAAAAVALRGGARVIATLEAPLRGQERSGSALVAENLRILGVSEARILRREVSHSTREEALRAHELAQQEGWGRLLVITSAYHIPRARRIFGEHFGEARASLHAPEGFLRAATAAERSWILEGSPSAETLQREGVLEARLTAGIAGLSLLFLPPHVRWSVEVAAGRLLRQRHRL